MNRFAFVSAMALTIGLAAGAQAQISVTSYGATSGINPSFTAGGHASMSTAASGADGIALSGSNSSAITQAVASNNSSGGGLQPLSNSNIAGNTLTTSDDFSLGLGVSQAETESGAYGAFGAGAFGSASSTAVDLDATNEGALGTIGANADLSLGGGSGLVGGSAAGGETDDSIGIGLASNEAAYSGTIWSNNTWGGDGMPQTSALLDQTLTSSGETSAIGLFGGFGGGLANAPTELNGSPSFGSVVQVVEVEGEDTVVLVPNQPYASGGTSGLFGTNPICLGASC